MRWRWRLTGAARIFAAGGSLTTTHSSPITAFQIAADHPAMIGIPSDQREPRDLSLDLMPPRKPCAGRKAKKKLIATHANSEIRATHSKRSHITISNRNTILCSVIHPKEQTAGGTPAPHELTAHRTQSAAPQSLQTLPARARTRDAWQGPRPGCEPRAPRAHRPASSSALHPSAR
jgi:hypothetical protein